MFDGLPGEILAVLGVSPELGIEEAVMAIVQRSPVFALAGGICFA